MIGQRIGRLGLVLTVATAVAFVGQLHANALPPGAPKVGMVCTNGSVSGTTRTFDLVANTGDITTPDGNAVFMWSYADKNDHGGAFQSPGPVLCATQGETIAVHLDNTLPEATSIVFPGQDSEVAATGAGLSDGMLTKEVPQGGTVTYTFTASQPGTYLYESGSDVAKQIEMGLYGALVIRPNSTTCPSLAAVPPTPCAYGSTSQYDGSREYVLLLAEIDPDLHLAVKNNENYDFNALHDRYFTINGRSFPDTIQDNNSGFLPTQPYGALVRMQPTGPNGLPTLVRLINVGLSNHPFHPHGNHTTEIAQDGRPVARTEHFGETIGSGQTEDFLLSWNDVDQWDPNTPGHQLPVAQPNYRNLTFKDGNTFYSGSPYLGYKGTLPTGTNQQNICGEWYFPWHSHALNEFANYDEGFGGMGTLLRVDPPGGCFAAPSSSSIVGGVLKSGSVTSLAVDDTSYYQVNPKTTTRTSATTAGQTSITVASAAGFPPAGAGSFYVRIDNEVMNVTGGQGTTTWTVQRGQLGTTAATHLNGATVTAMANDWYATFAGIDPGSANLKVTYKGRNCNTTTATTCTAFPASPPAAAVPSQTVKICNWTLAPSGCTATSSVGWVNLPGSQGIAVGTTDVTTTWSLPGPASSFVGTAGANKGQVRVLVHTQRWTGGTPLTQANSPTPFSTWGNFMRLVYDAP